MSIIGSSACGFRGCRYCDPNEHFTSTVYRDAKGGLELEQLRLQVAELEADQRRLEWLVDQEASVCYVFGAWSVWFDEETDAGVSGQDWRDVVDHAMKGEEGSNAPIN